MSLTSVVLPEPETPVTATKRPSGSATSMSLQVVGGARRGRGAVPSAASRRARRHRIARVPLRYCARERVRLRRAPPRAGPRRRTRRRARPRPGPMSTSQSAARMVSSSCSTTSTVLPRSRRRSSVRSAARCRAGAARSTARRARTARPTRLAPICVARRMRCASPPESVRRGAIEREVAEPDVDRGT